MRHTWTLNLLAPVLTIGNVLSTVFMDVVYGV